MDNFNCLVDNKWDVVSGDKHNTKVVQDLNNVLANLNNFDSFRLKYPNKKVYMLSRGHLVIARRQEYIFLHVGVSFLYLKKQKSIAWT